MLNYFLLLQNKISRSSKSTPEQNCWYRPPVTKPNIWLTPDNPRILGNLFFFFLDKRRSLPRCIHAVFRTKSRECVCTVHGGSFVRVICDWGSKYLYIASSTKVRERGKHSPWVITRPHTPLMSHAPPHMCRRLSIKNLISENMLSSPGDNLNRPIFLLNKIAPHYSFINTSMGVQWHLPVRFKVELILIYASVYLAKSTARNYIWHIACWQHCDKW